MNDLVPVVVVVVFLTLLFSSSFAIFIFASTLEHDVIIAHLVFCFFLSLSLSLVCSRLALLNIDEIKYVELLIEVSR